MGRDTVFKRRVLAARATDLALPLSGLRPLSTLWDHVVDITLAIVVAVKAFRVGILFLRATLMGREVGLRPRLVGPVLLLLGGRQSRLVLGLGLGRDLVSQADNLFLELLDHVD